MGIFRWENKHIYLFIINTRVSPLLKLPILKLRKTRNNPDLLTDIVDELFSLIILENEQAFQSI